MRNRGIREVLLLDIGIIPDPPTANSMTMEVAAEYIAQLYKAKQTIRWSPKKTRKTYIRDLKIDAGKSIMLLLYKGDKEAGGASFTNFSNDEQSDILPAEDEGRPESAHLVISFEGSKKGAPRYPALLELSGTLPRADVERYLNFLLREVRKVHKEHFVMEALDGAKDADGKPVMVKFTHKFSLQGHLSKAFQTELAKGALQSIYLETQKPAKIGFGEQKYVKPLRQSISLGISTDWKDKPAVVAEALTLGKKQQYEHTRVVFRSQDNLAHTAVLDSATGNVVGDGFIEKKRIINKAKNWTEAAQKIDTVLAAEMIRLLGV